MATEVEMRTFVKRVRYQWERIPLPRPLKIFLTTTILGAGAFLTFGVFMYLGLWVVLKTSLWAYATFGATPGFIWLCLALSLFVGSFMAIGSFLHSLPHPR